MQVIEIIIKIIGIIFSVFSILYIHKTIYRIVGFFTTRSFKPAKVNHRYAIMIAARNEETVIPNLIESIKLQNYPEDLISIFVVADNCTDRTAEVAREHGAVCYERFDSEHRTKGFALQFLVECIRRDYGIDSFEGYFIFDADNLLKSDFISHMNDAFDSGEKIITSYRNTKNFGDNWISASYGIHWLRTVLHEHKARSKFRLATRIQGTGFLFSWELIKDGWNYTSLTEDRAFCADAVANGYRISYNHKAEFFDEQPIDIKTAMRQRIRWAKGHLQAFTETSPKLLGHVFVTDKKVREQVKNEKHRVANGVRLRFISYDMLMLVFPYALLCFLRDIVLFLLNFILVAYSVSYFGMHYAPSLLREIFDFFDVEFLTDKSGTVILLFVLFSFANFAFTYLKQTFTAAYVFIWERKRITPIKWYKKIWFCLTFPLFDLIGKIATLIALFKRVEWKPIRHGVATNITEIEKSLEKK